MDRSNRPESAGRPAPQSFARGSCTWRVAKLLCLLGLVTLAGASQGPTKNLVFTQLSEIVSTSASANSLNQKTSTNQFTSSQQYSLWGWFRYTGASQTQANVLILSQAVNSNTPNSAGNNPNYPACPYSKQDFANNPSLMMMPTVAVNPNCFQSQTQPTSTGQTSQDLLYVNFNFYPATATSQSQFDLIFLIQNGLLNTTSIMNKEGFVNEKLLPNTWVFFAVSLDYAKQVGMIYFQPFDGMGSPGRLKNVVLSFPSFRLTPNLQLTLSSGNPNPYMPMVPFVGQIGYIELALFYTTQLNLMWMGYTPNTGMVSTTTTTISSGSTTSTSQSSSNPVSSDVVFNGGVNAITDVINNRQYPIQGGCTQIWNNNGGRVGLNFYSNSSVPFVNFQRSQVGNPIQSLTFFLQFGFKENLPQNFIIIQKGIQGSNSYFAISLNTVQGITGRVLQITASNRGVLASWTTPNVFVPGVTYSLIIGAATDMANGFYVIYMDANRSLFPLIKTSFPFDLSIDTGSNMLYLFNNRSPGQFNGLFSFYRFVLLNSASTAIYNALLSVGQTGNGVPTTPNGPSFNPNTPINITINNYGYNDTGFRYGGYNDFGRNWNNGANGGFTYNNSGNTGMSPNTGIFNPNGCILGSSYYGQSNYCLLCPTGQVSTLSGNCVASCPSGYATFGGNICLPCADSSCTSPSPTLPSNTTVVVTGGNGTSNGTAGAANDYLYWTIQEINSTHYRFVPSKPIINGTLNPYDLIKVNLTGFPPGSGYTLSNDLNNQWIDLYLQLTNGTYYNQNMSVSINGSGYTNLTNGSSPTVYTYPNSYYSNNGTWNYQIYQVCNLSGSSKTNYNGLAITVLVLFAVAALMLLALTCCCWSRTFDLGGLWKFLLHQWIKLTFVAFLIVLGVYLPCCLRQFLNILYLIAVRWDQAFSEIINNVYGGSGHPDYWSGIYNYAPPLNFRQMGVFPYILHNMMIAFIIHLFIATIWIVVMIWDCLVSTRGRCMYYTYVFMQFTVLIVGYGLFCMHAWVFASLNIRNTQFTHHYFIICFVISILYIAVFVFFWLYAAYRLCGASSYFLNEVNYANFYYFFAGYRETSLARTYDLFFYLAFFAIGLSIGFLWDVPIAQLVIILVALVLLFLVTVLMLPWRSWIFNIVELISLALLIVVAAMLLALAIYDRNGCFNCGNREFSFCWALVALLFVALVLPLLALFIQGLISACCPTRFNSYGTRKVYAADEAYYGYQFGQQGMNNLVTTTYAVVNQPVNVTALRRDTENIVVTDQVNERLVAADGYCAACQVAIGGCAVHGKGVQEQRIEGYDAKKSMLDFMNELRAKRLANNQKVRELETRNYATNMEDNIDVVDARNRSNSYMRRASQLVQDQPDEEYRQSRVLTALDPPSDRFVAGDASVGGYARDVRTNTTYTTSGSNTVTGSYATGARDRSPSRIGEYKSYDNYRFKKDY